MQRKADFGPLTEAQSARWDQAVDEYDRVFRENLERENGRAYSDEEWVKRREKIGIFHSYQPGHSKSSLFRRLLDGEQALPFPPPCAFSYPWYEVVESQGPIDGIWVAFEGERASAMTLAEHMRRRPQVPGIGIVQIQQSVWTVLEHAGDVSIVTYGEWAKAGYRWRLSWVETLASETRGSICCWHDRSKQRITTRDELWAEAEFHVMKDVNDMRAVHAGQDIPLDTTEKAQYSAMMLESRRQAALAKIQKRIERGWSPLPDRRSIRSMTNKFFAGYLHHKADARPSFRIDEQGRLLALQWRIERMSGLINGA